MKFKVSIKFWRTSFPDELSDDFLYSLSFDRNPVASDTMGSSHANTGFTKVKDVELPHNNYTKLVFDSSETDSLLNLFSVVHSSTSCIASATFSSFKMITL